MNSIRRGQNCALALFVVVLSSVVHAQTIPRPGRSVEPAGQFNNVALPAGPMPQAGVESIHALLQTDAGLAIVGPDKGLALISAAPMAADPRLAALMGAMATNLPRDFQTRLTAALSKGEEGKAELAPLASELAAAYHQTQSSMRVWMEAQASALNAAVKRIDKLKPGLLFKETRQLQDALALYGVNDDSGLRGTGLAGKIQGIVTRVDAVNGGALSGDWSSAAIERAMVQAKNRSMGVARQGALGLEASSAADEKEEAPSSAKDSALPSSEKRLVLKTARLEKPDFSAPSAARQPSSVDRTSLEAPGSPAGSAALGRVATESNGKGLRAVLAGASAGLAALAFTVLHPLTAWASVSAPGASSEPGTAGLGLLASLLALSIMGFWSWLGGEDQPVEQPVRPSKPKTAPIASAKPQAPQPVKGLGKMAPSELRKILLTGPLAQKAQAAREVLNRKIAADFPNELGQLVGQLRDPGLRVEMLKALGELKYTKAGAALTSSHLTKVIATARGAELEAAVVAVLQIGDAASLTSLGRLVETELLRKYSDDKVRTEILDVLRKQIAAAVPKNGGKPVGGTLRSIDKVLATPAASSTSKKVVTLTKTVYVDSSAHRYVPAHDDSDDILMAYLFTHFVGIPYPSMWGLFFYAMESSSHNETMSSFHQEVYQTYQSDVDSGAIAADEPVWTGQDAGSGVDGGTPDNADDALAPSDDDGVDSIVSEPGSDEQTSEPGNDGGTAEHGSDGQSADDSSTPDVVDQGSDQEPAPETPSSGNDVEYGSTSDNSSGNLSSDSMDSGSEVTSQG